MKLPIYQVDAFSDELFGGNPAAIIPLQEWLPDNTMQTIAAENNLSETAFFVSTGNGFHLRWFTPTVEVPLCGHATLAAAFVIYTELGYDKDAISFETLSGELIVRRKDDGFMMDFPMRKLTRGDIPADLPRVIDAPISELHVCDQNDFTLVVTKTAESVINAKPDLVKLVNLSTGNFILTAKSDTFDFVSRVFVPAHGIPEDPVTGSAHCVSAPFWAERLDKTTLKARQVSERGGNMTCSLNDDRVDLFGTAVLYLKGEINI